MAIFGKAYWGGALVMESCTYTMSHGISPGIAVYTMPPNPLGIPVATYGDLIFEDGVKRIRIPDCKVMSIKTPDNSGGQVQTLEIADRRWKWRDFGSIYGCYNQLDQVGKLIPWTTRSPREMAILCLDAMGEQVYDIDLPEGITQAEGERFTRILRPGELFPPSGTNPPIEWMAESPATVLQALAATFGRRVIYRLNDNSILIGIPGRGKVLPDGSIASFSPGVSLPARPYAVRAVGSPTRYQGRFSLEPVGKEWDGTYRPIDELSYAPVSETASVQITTATFANYSAATANYTLTINDSITITVPNGGTAALTMTAFVTAINANPALKGILTATAGGGTLTLSAATTNAAFAADFDAPPIPPEQFEVSTTQVSQTTGRHWLYSPPPFQPQILTVNGIAVQGKPAVPVRGAVQPTDRLTYMDAWKLAQETVWRCYRIKDTGLPELNVLGINVNPKPIIVPGYPKPIKRRQQLVLQDTQVEQVTPQPNDPNLKLRNGNPFTLNLYNGLSRDKPAAVFGSAYANSAFALVSPHLTGSGNTPVGKQYHVNFRVDPVEQMIIFDQPVFFLNAGRFEKPDLVLQTAVLVRDEDTNQLECYSEFRRLDLPSDDSSEFVQKFPDIQQNYYGVYNEKNVLTETKVLEDDAAVRAQYYLEGMRLQFPNEHAETREYNGLLDIDLDGAIQQVTLEVGAQGVFTVVSRNSEHAVWIAPYPARRRAEALPAAPQRVGLERLAIAALATGAI